MVLGLRTIWIVIRGTNYAGRAFDEVTAQMTKLQKEQAAVARQTRQIAMGAIFAGMMFMVMGGMIAMTFMRMIEYSSMGALMIEDLRRVIENLGTAIGESVIKQFGWVIQRFIDFMKTISEHKPLVDLITLIGLVGGAIIIVGGFLLLLRGIIALTIFPVIMKLGFWLGKLLFWLGLSHAAIFALKKGFILLAKGIAAGVIMFFLVATILKALPEDIRKPVAAIVALIAAIVAATIAWLAFHGTVTMGIAVPIILGAVGAGIAAMLALIGGIEIPFVGTLQYGKRMVTQEGLAMVHPYETISRVDRPILGMEPRVSPQKIYDIDIDVSIGEVHTEADEDELAQRVARKLSDEIDVIVG
uniref:Uncharacterized protein n=1 Tax=viral metagenome TaxID=1070528 RepID=A0A6H1ZRL2_9ZZZZ